MKKLSVLFALTLGVIILIGISVNAQITQVTNNTGIGIGTQLSGGNGSSILKDSLGNYYAVYRNFYSGSTTVFVRKSTDGGLTWKGWNGTTFAAAGDGTAVSSDLAMGPAAAIDSSNNIYIAYSTNTMYGPIRFIKYTAGSGTWSAPITVIPSGENPSIVVDGSGNITVACTKTSSGGISYNRYSSGAWGTAADLRASSTGAKMPSLAVDSTGNVHVAWQEFISGAGTQIRYSKYSSGAWSSPVGISQTGYTETNASIAIDNSDNLHVVWMGNGASYSNNQIWYVKYTSSWSSPLNIVCDSYDQVNPTIGIDVNNNIHVVWTGTSAVSYINNQVRYAVYTNMWNTLTNLTSGSWNQSNVSIAKGASSVVWEGIANSSGVSSGNAGVMFDSLKAFTTPSAAPASTDIADNGDGRDIRVNFNGAANETGISQYQIYVVPASIAATFDAAAASGLASSSFVTEPTNGVNGSHSVTLTQSLLDSTGTNIINGRQYKVFVLSSGQSGYAGVLSASSNTLTLTATGVFSIQSNFATGTKLNTVTASGGDLELSSTTQTEDFEDTNYNFTLSGQGARASEPHTGSWGYQVYATNSNGTDGMSATFTLQQAGNVTFWYSTSGLFNVGDFWSTYTFKIDGIAKYYSETDEGWTKASYALSAGTHTLTWEFDNCDSSGTEFIAIDDVTLPAYAASGTYTSNVVDISSVGTWGNSQISWIKTLPTNTNIVIETNLSTNGGSTWGGWQTATNGGTVTGISSGANVSNGRLQYRVTLSTTDIAVSPQLFDVVINLTAQTSPPVPTASITEVRDLYNNNDASDIRVIFKGASDESKIALYKVIVALAGGTQPTDTVGSSLTTLATNSVTGNYVSEPTKGKGRLHMFTLSSKLQTYDNKAVNAAAGALKVYVLSVAKTGSSDKLSAAGDLSGLTGNNDGHRIIATTPTVIDIDNKGNGSDMRVTFKKPISEVNIQEYRIIASTINLTPTTAGNVIAAGYTKVTPTSKGTSYTITMGATQTDQGGITPIQNGTSYKIYILLIGKNNYANVLSTASKNVTLLSTVPAALPVRNLSAAKIGIGHTGRNISVTFGEPISVTNVQEYRVFICTGAGTLDSSTAASLDNTKYIKVDSAGKGAAHTVILTGLNNIFDGTSLAAGDYMIYVLTVGKTGQYAGRLIGPSKIVKLN